MNCVAFRNWIESDKHLSSLHFLIMTKARRGDREAVVFNAGRFFDQHEDRFLAALQTSRGATVENTFSRWLLGFGMLLLIGGGAVAIVRLALLPVLIVSLFLLYRHWDRFCWLYRFDRSLKDYQQRLMATRRERREQFIRDIAENVAQITGCSST